MGSLHSPATGHCVSAAVPMCAVPIAFSTSQSWQLTETQAAGAAGAVATLLAVVALCTSSHLCQAHPATLGLEQARACPSRRVHGCVSTAPAPLKERCKL